MEIEEIINLPINNLADPTGCHLYLWVTNNYAEEGFKAIRSWGFKYITMITWDKLKIGLGQYFRGRTEHCLFAIMGHLPIKISQLGKKQQGETLIRADRTIHSQKPNKMREMIEWISYPPRIELFSRMVHPGWDSWGNEVGYIGRLNK